MTPRMQPKGPPWHPAYMVKPATDGAFAYALARLVVPHQNAGHGQVGGNPHRNLARLLGQPHRHLFLGGRRLWRRAPGHQGQSERRP
jgi:hypothetical protein